MESYNWRVTTTAFWVHTTHGSGEKAFRTFSQVTRETTPFTLQLFPESLLYQKKVFSLVIKECEGFYFLSWTWSVEEGLSLFCSFFLLIYIHLSYFLLIPITRYLLDNYTIKQFTSDQALQNFGSVDSWQNFQWSRLVCSHCCQAKCVTQTLHYTRPMEQVLPLSVIMMDEFTWKSFILTACSWPIDWHSH